MTEFHGGAPGGPGGPGEKKPSWRRAAPPVPAVPAEEVEPDAAPEPEAQAPDRTLVQPPAKDTPPEARPAPTGEHTLVTPSSGAPPVPATAPGASGVRRGSAVRPGTGAVGTGGTLILGPDATAAEFPEIHGVTIEREIGRGGMGVVYEGRQGYLDRRVAVKLLAAESHGDEFTRRFQREAKILASLSHPHIVACYQAGVAPDGRCFLVMEFIDGPSLEGWIGKHGALPPATAAAVCRKVASALAFAHGSGIIHRDVKPANVLLKSAPDAGDGGFPWQPTLADLGLARVARTSPSSSKLDVTPQDLTVQGTVMGSPPTMAPEQFDAPDDVDFRTDVYGLGCVLFHCLTGKQAFPQGSLTSLIARKTQGAPPDPREIRKDVPRAIAELVCAMLARDPADRPASYAELLQRFDAALAAPAQPARKRSPALGVALGVAVLAGGGWLATRFLGADAAPEPARDVARVEPPADPPVERAAVVPPPGPRGTGAEPLGTVGPDAGAPDAGARTGNGGATEPEPEPEPAGSDAAAPPPAEDPPVVVPAADPGPALPRIEPGETWPLFHGTTPLEGWEMLAGASQSDWSPVEDTRNGAMAFAFAAASGAERVLPAPPWELAGTLEMVNPAGVVTRRLALVVGLGPGDALVLRQGVTDDGVHLGAERARGPRDAPSEVEELPELALGPLARADYGGAAPVAFRVRWDGERLAVAWRLARADGSERSLELARTDFAGPVRLGVELEGGAAVLRDFVVKGL